MPDYLRSGQPTATAGWSGCTATSPRTRTTWSPASSTPCSTAPLTSSRGPTRTSREMLRTTFRSTSRHYVELCTGDQHHFPLSRGCRRQTSTSCHTCEAETVSLATCLRQQAFPAQQLLDLRISWTSDRVVRQGRQIRDDQHDHARVVSGLEVPEAHSAHRPGLLARGDGAGARPLKTSRRPTRACTRATSSPKP